MKKCAQQFWPHQSIGLIYRAILRLSMADSHEAKKKCLTTRGFNHHG